MLARVGAVLISVVLAARLVAADPPDSALSLFDAYLAEAARTMTAYRTDIRIGSEAKDLGPGRLAGESAYLGPFTYRPVTYAELSPAERAGMIRDPRFRSFLEERTRKPPADNGRPPAARRFSLTAEEMLRSGPCLIVLPP